MTALIRTLRNNWKKTIFFGIVGYVGTDYADEKYRSFMMMRKRSLEAQSYGKKPLPRGARTKHITFLLNPVANNRKGRDNFEKYAEPLIHLSGFLVNIVKTEKISEARELVELIEKTNIIGVAGGDGTLMEVVTGLLRREDAEEAVRRFPIALIPVGTHNLFAASFLHYNSAEPKDSIAQAAMNIAHHHMEPEDVIKVQLIPSPKMAETTERVEKETPLTLGTSTVTDAPALDTSTDAVTPPIHNKAPDEDVQKKPYFSMRGLQLGRFREAEKREDDMPRFLYGKFRTLWSLFRTPLVECKIELRYMPFCDGCARCREKSLRKPETKPSFLWRIFSMFRPSVYAEEHPKWKSLNPDCGIWESLCVDTTELNVLAQGKGKLEIQVGKPFPSTIEFLREGFRRKYGGVYSFSRKISCQEVEVFPITTPENYSIDNEDFPVKPIHMQVLRDRVYFFTQKP